ncbi:hypothetical protein ECC02_004273 [Trypanosoma cruzi]|uniref:Uncharacterized protein n=1 Tax=Trypanosoma cruzi TaxID=5693 RepID=A0A7J6Y8D3_TRYCR|nr:hypothetical protein ECC02_004273 [Trypanosoma cruzi]
MAFKLQSIPIQYRGCHAHVHMRTTPLDRQAHEDALQQRDVECLLWCVEKREVQHDRGGEGHVDEAQTTHTGIRIVHGADAATVHAADLRVLQFRDRKRPKAVRNRSWQTRVTVAASSAHALAAADAARPRSKAHGVHRARTTLQHRHGRPNIKLFLVIRHRRAPCLVAHAVNGRARVRWWQPIVCHTCNGRRVRAVREVVVKYRPHTPIAKRHAVLVDHVHNVGGAELVVAVHQPAAASHSQRGCHKHGEAKTESAGHNLQHAAAIHRNVPKQTRAFVDANTRRTPRAVLNGEHGAAADTQVRRKGVHHVRPRHNNAVVHVEDAGEFRTEAALHEDRSARVPATHQRRPRHDKPRRQKPDAVQD